MSLLGWLWLATPFILIGVISHDRNMRELIAEHRWRCHAIGWAGVAAMYIGVAVLPGAAGTMLYGIGAPLSGLIVWTSRDGRDDGGEKHPDGIPPDWDDFERSFRDYVMRRSRGPRRPRAPASR